MKTFVFFYFMKDGQSDSVEETAPEHTTYWQNQNPLDYKGGPFSDFSGGLISFQTENQNYAEKLIFADPFVKKDLLKNMWIKEWIS